MSCPLPDNPSLRATLKDYLPITIKCSLFAWLFGVLYLYSALAFPHKAYLFHLHTVFGSSVVVLVSFSVLWSIKASKTVVAKDRRTLLNWHRSSMLVGVGLTVVVAAFMLFKKGWFGGKGWLLVDRQPSYHSWSAILWMCVVVPLLTFSGMVIHQTKPPGVVIWTAKFLFGTLGAAKNRLRSVHKYAGVFAVSVLWVAAGFGLAEKNDDPAKHALAWAAVGTWLLILSQKALTT